MITVSKRFTRFFEISVECEFRKTIKGTKTEGNTDSARYLVPDEARNLEVAGTFHTQIECH